MKSWTLLPVVAVMVTMGATGAIAFQTVTSDPLPVGTMSTRLADPDDIVQDMSQRYTGNRASIAHVGSTTIGIIGPGYSIGESPFVTDPAAGTVPSKRQW